MRDSVDWSPLKRGGTNFRTHKLVSLGPEVMEFKATTGALIFYSLFMVFGAVPSALAFREILDNGLRLSGDVLIPLGFGAVFGTVGFFLFAFGTRPIVFDKNRGYFWKGRKDPDAVWSYDELKHFAEFKDIAGLQIITEWVSSSKSSYNSYELNLIMKDGSRRNVVDHGKKDKLEEDASMLAEFIGVPLVSR